MKILVCVDGSEKDIKVTNEAAKIAAGYKDNKQIDIFYVCELEMDWGALPVGIGLSTHALEQLREQIEKCDTEKAQKILAEAEKPFIENNIEIKKIYKQGNPAKTIINTANKEGYDIVVIGNRGKGGLFNKLFPGSVSSEVINEVKASVHLVK